MLHHFPSRDAVISGAVFYLQEKRLKEYKVIISKVHAKPQNGVTSEVVKEAIRATWKYFNLPSFFAYNELLVASRTERELAKIFYPQQKMFVRYAHIADTLIVAARAEDGTISLFVIDQGQDGITVEGLETIASWVSDDSVAIGEKCVLIGWGISHEGRKHYTGTALFGDNGSCRAVGYATWFEVPTTPDQ